MHTIIKLPNTTFVPYAIVATNILFIEAGSSTDKIWFYQHKVPKGQRNYYKTKPIQLSEFDGEKNWWNSRTENDSAWQVTVEDIVDKGYKIDFKNPRAKDDDENWDLKDLIKDISDNYDTLVSCVRKLNLS